MKKGKITPAFLNKLITTPSTVIEKLDLIYTNSHQLSIQRIKNKKGFSYIRNKKPVSGEILERIEKLVIPPAWEKVRITHLSNGHLQATGKDAKNRKQYRYHPLWAKVRNQTKFYKMAFFAEQLPALRKQIEKDLRQKKWVKTKVLALVVKLMEETHIRIGNRYYAKKNKSYGLSTLRTKHVHFFKNKLKFEFTGKKGIKHSVTLRNKKLIQLVSRCEELPGWQLFQYIDEEGNKNAIDSSMINEYLREISGELFTAKDFRTWGATVIFFNTLMETGMAETPEETAKNLLEAHNATAKALGNTRNVCRKYYVHPLIVAKYEDGSLKKSFAKVEKSKSRKRYFTKSEEEILKIIKNYKPNLED